MGLSIVSRYLIREIAQAWLAVTLVLTAVLFTNRLVRYLGDAASGSLPGDMVLQLMGYKALSYLALAIPGAFFLGIILALGRLYRDSEMAALGACGIGPRELYKALILLAAPLALLIAWLALEVGPWAAREGREAEQLASEAVEIQAIRPGRFIQSGQADGMFYIERFSEDGERMRNVFLQTRQGGEQILLAANEGYVEADPDTGDQYLVLLDGRRYDGDPGGGRWREYEYKVHGVRIAEGEPPDVRVRRDGMPTRELLASDDLRDISEFQWRVSMPIMVITLGLMAIPLSRSSPRDGRYGRLLLAVLVYAIYSNGLTVSQGWLEDGTVPPWIGLWPVHLLVAAIAVVWLSRQYGLLRPRRRPDTGGEGAT
ncbi:LPS export ABC transporter permease LptF [Aquisalimonas asiatica]|uniref:Lipopolysaccharide export system permease protein LptF n=1 Tax=Aquisalimonas asiatica TaxID=406100 RepID=A0A1H8R0A3_9GAMM|nr:LPS export ABC transporter permease LptF [Aquisalimonas asiatica]SEO59875.1 lipopolysaccharide export system permease protein [Aquisalimonas asiatica]